MRIPIRFEPIYARLSSFFLLPARVSFMEVAAGGGDVVVRMGWAFAARFPRAAVSAAAPSERRPLSRGVHGWAGRWLVNGAGDRVLRIDLAPEQRARVMGFPVRLRQLLISVDDPAAVARLLLPPT